MIYIGDANDPATILADVDTFFSANFSDPNYEVKLLNGFSPLHCMYVAKDKQWESTLPSSWEIGQRTSGLAQVYDLVLPFDAARAASFLERLGVIAKAVLANRDDVRHFPADWFRERVMPA